MPEVLEDLHPLEDIPADRKLLAEGQSRRYRRLALLSMFHPDLAFFCLHMAWVEGVNLHGAPMAPSVASLLGDAYEIEGV